MTTEGRPTADPNRSVPEGPAPPTARLHPEEAVWLLLLVAVPVAFAPWLAHPFELLKATLVRAGALPLMGAVGPAQWRGLRRDPLPAAALALAVTVVAASALGWAPVRSVFGSSRAMGALTWLSFLVLFAAVARWCPGAQGRRAIRLAALAGGLPVALYGLVQAGGVDPWHWQGDASSPVGTTLGRSNFTGALMAMLLPLALSGMLAAEERRQRWLPGALGALYGLVLLTTAARAAWLGAVAGCSVLAVGWWRYRAAVSVGRQMVSGRLWLTTAILLAMGVAVGLALAAGQPWLPDVLTAGRLAAISWNPASPGTRLTLWRWSLPLIAARPLLGYGPDTADLAFPTLWRGARIDRAHNLVLDLALEFGLVGLALYLAVVLLVLRGAWQRLLADRPPDADLWLGAMGALAAFWTATLFSFGVVTTWLLHWILLGLLASGWRRDAGPACSSCPPTKTLALIVFGLALQAPLVAADAYARRAAVVMPADLPSAQEAARRAVALAPFEARYRIALARTLVALAGPELPEPRASPSASQPPSPSALDEAVQQATVATELARRDAYVWLAAAEVYRSVAALTGEGADLDRAANAFRQAGELDRRLAEAESGWGLTEYLRGDAEAAVQHYRAAIAIDESDGRTYYRLGQALLDLELNHQAAEAFARAVGNEPELVGAWVGHGIALCRVGKQEEAIRKLEHALQLAPGDTAAAVALAACRAGE